VENGGGNRPILGENCGVVTSSKITQKGDKNNHDEHPNTPISINRSINAGEEKKVTFLLPQNKLQLARTTLSFSKKNPINPTAYTSLESWRRRES
jgi:hypothetical protein